MAACEVKSVLAPNGKESILYRSLRAHYKDQQKALEAWTILRLSSTKEVMGDWQSEDYDQSKLDANGEPLFETIINEDFLEREEARQAVKGTVANKIKRLERIEKLKASLEDSLSNKIRQMESQMTPNKKIVNSIKALKTNLANLSSVEAMLTFTSNAKNEINMTEYRFEKELNGKARAISLSRLKDYVSVYDFLDGVLAEFTADPELRKTFKSELSDMRDIIATKEAIKNSYREHMRGVVAKELSKFSNKLSEEDIENLLNRAESDISSSAKVLDYLGDSKDPILALVAKQVDEQQQKTRENHIVIRKELVDKLRAVEEANPKAKGNSRKLFDKILVKDEQGNLTGEYIDSESIEFQLLESNGQDKALVEFYKFFDKQYKDAIAKLPGTVDMGNRLPAIMRGDLERIKATSDRGFAGTMREYVDNKFKKSNMDEDRGQIVDDDGQPVNYVPVMFTASYDSREYNRNYARLVKEGVSKEEAEKQAKKIATEIMPKTISYDLAESLSAFTYMAENFQNISEIMTTLDAAKDLVTEREYKRVDSNGIPLLNKLKDRNDRDIVIKGNESNAAKQIDSFFKMQVYGQMRQELGSFSLLGQEIDTSKLIGQIKGFASIQLLAVNVTAGISNVAMGETMQWAEAMAGEYYNAKDYRKATTEYAKLLGSTLGDVGSRSVKGKVNLLNEMFDFLGEYTEEVKGVEAEKATKLAQVANASSVFFIMKAGEHAMQSRAAMAHLMGIETFDSKGKPVGNLYDSFKVVDGVLKQDEVYIKRDGALVKYDVKEKRAIARRVGYMLRYMHGNYKSTTAVAWQRNAVYGLIGHCRKWVRPGFNRRFGKKYYNEMADRDIEGNYIATLRFLNQVRKDIARFKFDLVSQKWSDLDGVDRANIRRSITEVGVIACALTATLLMSALGGGLKDDDDSARAMAIRSSTYFTNRLFLELTAFMSPGQMWDLIKSPATCMSPLEAIGKCLEQLIAQDIYERGPHKGEYKLTNYGQKLIPIWKQIRSFTPEGMKDKNEYFSKN